MISNSAFRLIVVVTLSITCVTSVLSVVLRIAGIVAASRTPTTSRYYLIGQGDRYPMLVDQETGTVWAFSRNVSPEGTPTTYALKRVGTPQ